jgi:quercetin dioxygenase-like cupin family protein
MPEAVRETIEGDGYALGHIDGLGEGPGFRKVRRHLGVTAFGVNVVVIPPGIEGRRHDHERQEELYFVHRGEIEMEFGDGASYLLGEGALARVDADTVRVMRTAGDSDGAVVLAVGGEGGYVGRDGRPADPGTGA